MHEDMPFRFIHTADIHLDSPLRSLALRNADLAELIGGATRAAFSQIVDLACEEAVDAVLIAGDLYDGAQTSMKTAVFLAHELQRLDAAGIRTFLIRGNHDAASRITNELTLPDGVTTFTARAETVTLTPDAPYEVAIHGVSFRQPHAPDSLLDRFKPPVAGAVNIAMLHTSLGGAPGHDPYAPCQPADLDAMGFDYWALGHIHQRGEHGTTARIVMPGIPQGRDIGEAGEKTVSLVTIADDRSITIEERAVALARFERVAVDLSGIEDWPDMVSTLESALRAARAAVDSRHLVARLDLVGQTPLSWRLRRDVDRLAGEAEAIALAIGDTWIDKIANATAPARAETEIPSADGAPLHELSALINGEILQSPGYRQAVEALADDIAGQLPGEIRDMLGEDTESRARILADLAREGAQDILARLQAMPESGDA